MDGRRILVSGDIDRSGSFHHGPGAVQILSGLVRKPTSGRLEVGAGLGHVLPDAPAVRALQYRDVHVVARSSDRVGHADAGTVNLGSGIREAVRKLQVAFCDLEETGPSHRVPAGLEASGEVGGQASADPTDGVRKGVAGWLAQVAEQRLDGLVLFHQAQISQVDGEEAVERVMGLHHETLESAWVANSGSPPGDPRCLPRRVQA